VGVMREGPKSVRLSNPSRTVSGSSPALTTKRVVPLRKELVGGSSSYDTTLRTSHPHTVRWLIGLPL